MSCVKSPRRCPILAFVSFCRGSMSECTARRLCDDEWHDIARCAGHLHLEPCSPTCLTGQRHLATVLQRESQARQSFTMNRPREHLRKLRISSRDSGGSRWPGTRVPGNGRAKTSEPRRRRHSKAWDASPRKPNLHARRHAAASRLQLVLGARFLGLASQAVK